MWVIDEVGRLMRPLLNHSRLDVAWHAGQYQAPPPVSSRTARSRSLDARGRGDRDARGRMLAPFMTRASEGVALDDEDDFARAEELAASGRARLPAVEREPYPGQP